MAERIEEIMAADIHFLAPDMSVREAAQLMAEVDAGALPVGGPEALCGMLTDRDVLIRVVARGRDPEATRVEEVMSSDVLTCRADDGIADIVVVMRTRQVRRLPVRDADGRVVGLVAMRMLLAALAEPDSDEPGPLR